MTSLPDATPPQPRQEGAIERAARTERPARRVKAVQPHELWHVDLTTVPIAGRWLPWLPFTLPSRWPFAWWVVVVLDHYSRAVIARSVFRNQPSAAAVCKLLDRARRFAGRAPRHIVTDRGVQFQTAYRGWCARHAVRPRFGAIGKKGSLAVIERFFRSLKGECFRRILVPLRTPQMIAELSAYIHWYNHHRPHDALANRTPGEALSARTEAASPPPIRVEPRARYPIPPSRRRADTARRTHRITPIVTY
jgi:putative transposase